MSSSSTDLSGLSSPKTTLYKLSLRLKPRGVRQGLSMQITERWVFGNTMALRGHRSPLQTPIFWGPMEEIWSPISLVMASGGMMARPGLYSLQTTLCSLSLRLAAALRQISTQITEHWVFGNTITLDGNVSALQTRIFSGPFRLRWIRVMIYRHSSPISRGMVVCIDIMAHGHFSLVTTE